MLPLNICPVSYTHLMGFSDIVITDKYIYSVFQGIRFKDKLASYQRGEKPEDGGWKYIIGSGLLH